MFFCNPEKGSMLNSTDPFVNQDAKLLKVNRKINDIPKNIAETIPPF